MPDSDLERLREENAALRHRIAIAEHELGDLRAEAIERRRELRRLAETVPVAISRKAVLKAILADAAAPLRRHRSR